MSGSDLNKSLFRALHHVSLVVENLEESVSRLERLGLGPFVDYPPLDEYVELEVRDARAFYDLRIKVCELGGVALQVIEAGSSNTPYGDFLRDRGEGIFHLGFQVDDVAAAERSLRSRGAAILATGRREDGSGFAYLDTAREVGVTLLVRQSPGSGPLPGAAGSDPSPVGSD